MGVGVGESCNAPATYSMTADMFPRDKLARAISVIGIGQVAGSGMALLVGGTVVVWLTKMGDIDVPVLGALRAWQLTFMIVGLPGILWALLMVATVPEPPRRNDGLGVAGPSLGDVIRFLGRWKFAYLPMVLATGIKSIAVVRHDGVEPDLLRAQVRLGGRRARPLPRHRCADRLADWPDDRRLALRPAHPHPARLRRRQYARRAVGLDRYRAVRLAVPVDADAGLGAGDAGRQLFFGSVGAGPGNAAMQVITPGRMRGTVTALYIAVFNVLGYGVGPLIVALITDNVFGDEQRLPEAMGDQRRRAGAARPLLSWLSLKPYERAAKEAGQRDARVAAL